MLHSSALMEYRVSVRGYELPMVPTIYKEKLIIDWSNHLYQSHWSLKIDNEWNQPTISYKYIFEIKIVI